MLFGDIILALRTRLGLTQKALAQKVGVSVATIRNWERDVSRNPYTTLIKMCKALHTDPNTLLGYPTPENILNGLTEEQRILILQLIQHMCNANAKIEDQAETIKEQAAKLK